MKLIEIKTLMYEILLEEINKDQLISVAKFLNMNENKLRAWIDKVDPTENKGFSVWLLRGLKKQWIRLEDGERAKQALERFIQLRRVNRIGDIMQYPHINDLETAIDSLSGVGAKRQGFSGVDPETLPGVEKWKETKDITFYKVANADSLAEIGEGTKWCTRKSYGTGLNSQANYYIKQYGFIIVGYKDGKPFVQLNPDYSQVMDVNDVSFKGTSKDELMSIGFPEPPFPMYQYWDPDHPHYRAYERWSKLTGNPVDFPEYPKKPTKYSLTLGGEEPRDVSVLRRWGKEKGRSIKKMLPQITPDFWEKFESRVAKSISRANSYGAIIYTMRGWEKMFSLTKKRTPEVEKAILDKDWSKVGMRYFGGGGLMKHLPGMFEIIEYVKTIIKGHWPEYEDKIQYDKFNTIYYHMETNLDPVNVKDPIIKHFITIAQTIKRKDPSTKTPEFKGMLRDFILKNRTELTEAGLSKLITKYILRPYFNKAKMFDPTRSKTLYGMLKK